MATHVTGQNAVDAAVAPTLHLGTYRRAIMSAMSADVFTSAERLRANHSVYESQDSAKLALWLKNVVRVRDEREAAGLATFTAAVERGNELLAGCETPKAFATAAQCDEVFRLASKLPKKEKADVLRRLPLLTESEAEALLRGLKHRQGSRLFMPVQVGKRQIKALVVERHFEAARVDYVEEAVTGLVLPRRETLWGGRVVRQLWNN